MHVMGFRLIAAMQSTGHSCLQRQLTFGWLVLSCSGALGFILLKDDLCISHVCISSTSRHMGSNLMVVGLYCWQGCCSKQELLRGHPQRNGT